MKTKKIQPGEGLPTAPNWWRFAGNNLRTLLVAFALLFTGTAIGVAGFMYIEQLNFADALFMSVIILSTVGMNETHALSPHGRIFVTAYILINFSIFAYFVSVVTRYIFEGELQQVLKNYMKGKQVSQLRKHIVICGFGRYGRKVCEQLESHHLHNFLIIERDRAKLAEHYDDLSNITFIEGDATDDDVLKQAGIEHASALITTLPEDASNIYVVLSAREINPDVKIIARASSESASHKLKRAGASHVVMPDVIGGMQMANLVIRPEVVEFVDLLSGVGENSLRLEEVAFSQLREEFRKQPIRELQMRNRTGVTVIGFKDSKQGYLFNPNPERVIDEGDILIVIGRGNEIKAFLKHHAKK